MGEIFCMLLVGNLSIYWESFIDFLPNLIWSHNENGRTPKEISILTQNWVISSKKLRNLGDRFYRWVADYNRPINRPIFPPIIGRLIGIGRTLAVSKCLKKPLLSQNAVAYIKVKMVFKRRLLFLKKTYCGLFLIQAAPATSKRGFCDNGPNLALFHILAFFRRLIKITFIL